MQDGKAAPPLFIAGRLCCECQDFGPVGARERALPDNDQRPLCLGELLAEALPGQDIGEAFRADADLLTIVGERDHRTYQPDREIVCAPALADARAEAGRLP